MVKCSVLAKKRSIDKYSCVPLHIGCFFDKEPIGQATGFVVAYDSKNYLVTNRHVVTGRHFASNQPLSTTGAVPDKIAVWFHVRDKLGSWVCRELSLFGKSGERKWKEASQEENADVVALPVNDTPDTAIYPLDLTLADTDLLLPPSEPVSIIGFPFGMAASGKFPIWKTGHIASDLDLDYDKKPVFLIDAKTRSGMSGSPVLARRLGMHVGATGCVLGGGDVVRFLGVYSGRTNNDSDIGLVWKPEVLKGILK